MYHKAGSGISTSCLVIDAVCATVLSADLQVLFQALSIGQLLLCSVLRSSLPLLADKQSNHMKFVALRSWVSAAARLRMLQKSSSERHTAPCVCKCGRVVALTHLSIGDLLTCAVQGCRHSLSHLLSCAVYCTRQLVRELRNIVHELLFLQSGGRHGSGRFPAGLLEVRQPSHLRRQLHLQLQRLNLLGSAPQSVRKQ